MFLVALRDASRWFRCDLVVNFLAVAQAIFHDPGQLPLASQHAPGTWNDTTLGLPAEHLETMIAQGRSSAPAGGREIDHTWDEEDVIDASIRDHILRLDWWKRPCVLL